MSKLNWKKGCFVSTIYLVNENNEVLLSWNDRVNAWVPIGGHLDEGETPLEAIKREVKEELGIDFHVIPQVTVMDKGKVLLLPASVQIEKVPHHNFHINFVFYGRCKKFNKTTNDEGDKLRWFGKEDILTEDLLDNVRYHALKALEYSSKVYI